MQHRNSRMMIIAAVFVAALQLAACGQASSVTASKIQPVTLEKTDQTGINRLVLTEKAAERLAIQTAQVREEQVNGTTRKVIPYAAMVYGVKGETWTYTSPAPLTFVRQPITVDHIDGDNVILADGPAAGTAVAITGVSELYGADTGIGK